MKAARHITASPDVPRVRCVRCRRPESACWCDALEPVTTRTRVVLFQHPREARVAIGTALMVKLGLTNAERHIAIDLDASTAMTELDALPRDEVALLYPAAPGEPVPPPPAALSHLVVIDGTWAQAKKLLKLNPRVAALPRFAIKPEKPGNYRIRHEPTADSLATVEAVVAALRCIEPERDFDGLVEAFDRMVDRQISFASSGSASYRFVRGDGGPPRLVRLLLTELDRLVLVHAETNQHRPHLAPPGEPELLQLVAVRLADGETFEGLAAPRRRLSTNTPHQLELPPETIHSAGTIEEVRSRFEAFRPPDSLLVAWTPWVASVLAREGLGESGSMREAMAAWLRRSPGGPERGAELMEADVGPMLGQGRAGRLLATQLASLESLRRAVWERHPDWSSEFIPRMDPLAAEPRDAVRSSDPAPGQ